jgi:hypothetical protein
VRSIAETGNEHPQSEQVLFVVSGEVEQKSPASA